MHVKKYKFELSIICTKVKCQHFILVTRLVNHFRCEWLTFDLQLYSCECSSVLFSFDSTPVDTSVTWGHVIDGYIQATVCFCESESLVWNILTGIIVLFAEKLVTWHVICWIITCDVSYCWSSLNRLSLAAVFLCNSKKKHKHVKSF